MALSGSFTTSGESSSIHGLTGNVEVMISREVGAKSTIWLQISTDSGATWYDMGGGSFGNGSFNGTMIASDSTIYYRFKAAVGAGTTNYYLGQD